MLEHVLIPKHGFPPIPLEAQHCSMARRAGERLSGRARDLGEGARASVPERPRRPAADAADVAPAQSRARARTRTVLHWVFDAEKLARLIEYCAQDVRTTRAVWQHPKLKPLIADERRYQILDAIINRARRSRRSRARHQRRATWRCASATRSTPRCRSSPTARSPRSTRSAASWPMPSSAATP